MERDYIFERYPFLMEGSKFIVMGDDLDAALSSVLFLHLNKKSKLVGVYSKYYEICFSPTYFNDFESLISAPNVVWLDLDINYLSCTSVGHHIVRYSRFDRLYGFDNSCNLNELRKISVRENYEKKYPLGTIHFLIWLYDICLTPGSWTDVLIWLADSSFINAQSHRFRDNVGEWLTTTFFTDFFMYSYKKLVDSLAFEKKVCLLQQKMERRGFKKGPSRVRSKYLGLSGFQCQADQIPIDICKLIKFITELTGWQIEQHQISDFCSGNLNCVSGIREEEDAQKIINKYENLDNFLMVKNIFSFVFPYKKCINFTVFENP